MSTKRPKHERLAAARTYLSPAGDDSLDADRDCPPLPAPATPVGQDAPTQTGARIPFLSVEVGERLTAPEDGDLTWKTCVVLRFTEEAPPVPGAKSKAKWHGPLTHKKHPGLTGSAEVAYLLRQTAEMIEKSRFRSADGSVSGDLLCVMAHDMGLADGGAQP